MGTHPIFESDFDCLTERKSLSNLRTMAGRAPPNIDGMISLKIDNPSYRTDLETLRRKFGKYGDIGDVYIPKDKYGESRGFAFVRYYSKRDAGDAIDSLDGRDVDGREIRVDYARHERPPLESRRRSRSRSRDRRRSRSRSRGRRSRSRSYDRRRRSRSRSRSRSYDRRRSDNRRRGGSRSNSRSRSASRSNSRSRSR